MGGGKSHIIYEDEKAWPSINHSIFSGYGGRAPAVPAYLL
jgi:hypothetical protein